MFRQKVASKFTSNVPNSNLYSNSSKSKNKSVKITKIPPPIPARPPKGILEKSKFFEKGNIKIKERLFQSTNKKIENIYKIINDSEKPKSKIKLTAKDLSRKQIIVSMDNENKIKFMTLSSDHVINLNKTLKNIKSDIIIDYICIKQNSITIVTSKVALSSDLQVIENIVKNVENTNFEDIETPYLPQSK